MKPFSFKKIVVRYIIFFIIILLISASVVSFSYKDKLLFAYNYNRISEKIEEERVDISDIKTDISSLAKNSEDIVDILILDNQNKILFSAKGSDFSHEEAFNLELRNTGKDEYLTYIQNPDISFRLMRKEKLILSTVLLENEERTQKRFSDDTFFENNHINKKIYMLSYAVNDTSGDKVYFISDIQPVKNSRILIATIAAVLILLLMLYLVLVALWVYQDARKSRVNAMLWGILTLFTNLAGLFVYLIYKQNNQICTECSTLQNKGNAFCVHCGAKINKTCGNCNSIVSSHDRYCHKCGEDLNDEKNKNE